VIFSSRTLLALAAIAPLASALDVKDDDLKLGLKLQLQVCAQKGWAEGKDNNRYDATTGTVDAAPDTLDFSVRRARIGFVGTYKEVYRFAYMLRNDTQDKSGSATVAGNRVPETHVAYLARDFKTETYTQQIRAGLDYAFFNGAALNSAAWSPMVAARATEQAAMLAPRGVGIGYKYTRPQVTIGVDIQNNAATASTVTTPASGDSSTLGFDGYRDKGEGLFYGLRVEAIAWDDAATPHMKPQESFMGAPGKGVLITLDVGTNRDDNISATETVNTYALGSEIFVHWDALTAVAEVRLAQAKTTSSTIANSEKDRRIYLIQAAYALPIGDYIVEPGIRFTRINLDDDTEEAVDYGSAEYGSSGFQWDLGATLYLNRNSNKVAVGYQNWRGEGGGPVASNPGDAKANIIRAQWSLSF